MTVAPAFAPTTGDRWWVIDEIGAVAAARRTVAAMAADLRFDENRIAEVGIVVSELATNLVRHAGGGQLAVRVGDDAVQTLRIMAIDSGPGSRDISALIADGASTSTTLGIGLGACIRLSSSFDIYSVPAVGTVVEVEMGATRTSEADPRPAPWAAALTRPLSGEGPCGDATAAFARPRGWLAMVADGLGHGPLAAIASERAAEVLASCQRDAPAAALARMHTALNGTRGAAISVVEYDAHEHVLRHAGVGNIVVRVVSATGERSLLGQPGIVGHRMPHVREVAEQVPEGSLVVLHSDGLSQRWTLGDLPGVLQHRPAVVGACLMRAASTRRDDAGVLVLRTLR